MKVWLGRMHPTETALYHSLCATAVEHNQERAIECRLAEAHGPRTLRNGSLGGAPLDLEAARPRLLAALPQEGRLAVTFCSQRRPTENTKALSKKDFYTLWTRRAPA
jgi:hypothetical protein